MTNLTAAQARCIALAAQQLDRRVRPGTRNRAQIRKLLSQLGVFQIDSVNVLARAHYLPAFARLGNYDTSLVDDAAYSRRHRVAMESWAHCAALLPVEREVLMRHRMAAHAERARERDRLLREHPDFVTAVLNLIGAEGAMTAGEVECALAAPARTRSGWWEWSQTKHACELLFYTGSLLVTGRRRFERVYDLPERVLPAAVLTAATPAAEEAVTELVALALGHLGIGTLADIADYYRLKKSLAASALAELVRCGRAEQVTVTGWAQPAWLDPGARRPRTATGAALLCPFDPMIWFRERTERIFGIRYRIEIYTPAAKRVYGYYVFCLLVGQHILARLDLKADRASGVLRVQAAHLEDDVSADLATAAGAEQLHDMARWLGLTEVAVADRGNLAAALRRAL